VPRPAKIKEKLTLSFNPALKSPVVKAAKRSRVSPGTQLENLAMKKFDNHLT
jgi:hypothetical protein